jgi:hypothetical protein
MIYDPLPFNSRKTDYRHEVRSAFRTGAPLRVIVGNYGDRLTVQEILELGAAMGRPLEQLDTRTLGNLIEAGG